MKRKYEDKNSFNKGGQLKISKTILDGNTLAEIVRTNTDDPCNLDKNNNNEVADGTDDKDVDEVDKHKQSEITILQQKYKDLEDEYERFAEGMAHLIGQIDTRTKSEMKIAFDKVLTDRGFDVVWFKDE